MDIERYEEKQKALVVYYQSVVTIVEKENEKTNIVVVKTLTKAFAPFQEGARCLTQVSIK